MEGFNTKNKRVITYWNLESARRPIPHSIDVPVSVLPKLIHFASTESTSASEELDEQYVCSIEGCCRTFSFWTK